MDVFSLEEDDCSQMFITQSSPKRAGNETVLGDPLDFASPCVSLVGAEHAQGAQYSDISDEEFVQIPCSQPRNKKPDDSKR